jgi:hypothetical protein
MIPHQRHQRRDEERATGDRTPCVGRLQKVWGGLQHVEDRADTGQQDVPNETTHDERNTAWQIDSSNPRSWPNG